MNKWFPKYSDIILYSKLSVGNMYTHTHTHTHTLLIVVYVLSRWLGQHMPMLTNGQAAHH